MTQTKIILGLTVHFALKVLTVHAITARDEEKFHTLSVCSIVARINATVKKTKIVMPHTSAKITSAMYLIVKMRPGKSSQWVAIAIILLNATQTHVIGFNQSITKLDSEIIQYVSLLVIFSLN
jgi:hypothetical protein